MFRVSESHVLMFGGVVVQARTAMRQKFNIPVCRHSPSPSLTRHSTTAACVVHDSLVPCLPCAGLRAGRRLQRLLHVALVGR